MFLSSSPQAEINIPQWSFLKQKAEIPINIEDTHILHPQQESGIYFSQLDEATDTLQRHIASIHNLQNIIAYITFSFIF